MALKSEVEKKDNLATIRLEIPSDQTVQEYNKACRRLSHRVNIPGFRRGKAPRAVIEKTIGSERIRQEALDRLLPPAFADAISEHQLDIVAPPQIENFNFDLNNGVSIKASVELRPDCKLPEFDKLLVKVPQMKLPADAEQKEIEFLMERLTTLEPVIDRETKDTDIVQMDFSGSINGEPIKGGAAKNYRLDIAHNNFIEGFGEQLIGRKLGQEFTIEVTFPEDYHDKTIAGKPAQFKVKINEIKEKKMPELNDDLVKKLGNYETVDALKTAIRENLTEREDQENSFRKQKNLIETIVAASEVEISPTMIAREVGLLSDEIKNRLKSQGISWEQFVSSQGQEEVLNNLRKEATQRIKTSLVFGSIAKVHDLRVTDEEFSEKIKELAEVSQNDEKYVLRQLANNPQATQSLNDQILSQKIVSFLEAKVKYELVEETEDDEVAALTTTTAAEIIGEEVEVVDEA